MLEVSLAESDREVAGTGPVLQPGKRSVPARLPQPGPRADRRLILYDDLDPHALDTGIVHFDGRYFGATALTLPRGMSVQNSRISVKKSAFGKASAAA